MATTGPSRTKPPPAPPPTPARTNAYHAAALRESASAAVLCSSVGELFPSMDPAAFKIYRDQLLADAGNPRDPIEVMLIEQVALAHLNSGRLLFRSATAPTVAAVKAYGQLATQLMGEVRRSALALQTFRLSALRVVVPVVVNESQGAATPTSEATPESATNPTPEMVSEKWLFRRICGWKTAGAQARLRLDRRVSPSRLHPRFAPVK